MGSKRAPPMFEAKPGIASEFLSIVTKAPDTRIRVSIISEFCTVLCRLSPDLTKVELEDDRCHLILFNLFVASCKFHQTVNDIIGYVTDTFITIGPDSLRTSLVKLFESSFANDSLPASSSLNLCDRILDRVQLNDLLLERILPTIYSFLFKFLPSSATMKDGFSSARAEIEFSTNTAVALKLIRKISGSISTQFRSAKIHREIIIQSCMSLEHFFLNGGHRYPDIYISSVSLYLELKLVLGEDTFTRSEQPGDSNKLSNNLLDVTCEVLSCKDSSQSFEDVLEKIQSISEYFPTVGKSLIITVCENFASNSSKETQTDSEKENFVAALVKLWIGQLSAVLSQGNLDHAEATLATSVRILSLVVNNWKYVHVEDEGDIRQLLRSLPENFLYSTYGQRTWILLLPVIEMPDAKSLWKPGQILDRLPTKYFGVQMVQLLALTATPNDTADIVLNPAHRAFLTKSVLPVLISRPGFVPQVLQILSDKEHYEGYGPLLHALRSTKVDNQEAMRRELFQKYIRGKADVLTVLPDDATRLEIFICFSDAADPITDFEEFAKFVEYNLDQQFLKFREPFMRAVARFFNRINVKLSSKSSARTTDAVASNPKNSEILEKLLQFFHLLVHQCNPSSSYARRTMSLQIMKGLLSGPLSSKDAPDLQWESISTTLIEQLFWETFPDNLGLIVEVLYLRPKDQGNSLLGGFDISQLVCIADAKARSCATNDPKVATSIDVLLEKLRYVDETYPDSNRIYKALDELRTDVISAKKFGMLRAARSAPIYGQLYRLRSLIVAVGIGGVDQGRNRSTVETILGVCREVADMVNEALEENSAQLSMDKDLVLTEGEVMEKQGSTTAQQLFVCCWHCMRELTLVLGEVCCGKITGNFVVEEEKIQTFEWMVKQLLQTQHTGAFEGLAEQIARMARMFAEEKSITAMGVVGKTLDGVLMELRAWSSPLCPENSRKSAGLPRLLAILFVALNRTDFGWDAFEQTMSELMAVASGKTEGKTDDRVRAIDILEALFRDNSLNEVAEKFIGEGFMVACDSVASSLWPVRNSAAGLFTALMQRIFGPAVRRPPDELQWRESCLPAQKFFGKYSGLFDYFQDALKQSTNRIEKYDPNDRQTSTSYCALLVLQRLYPTVGDSAYLRDLTDMLIKCAFHPELRLRQAAAEAAVLFLSEAQLQNCLQKFMVSFRWYDEYSLHGVLLIALELHRIGCFLMQFGSVQETFYSHLLQFFGDGFMDQFSYSTKDMLLRLFLKFDRWTDSQIQMIRRKLKEFTVEFSRENCTADPWFNMWAEDYATASIRIHKEAEQKVLTESLIEDLELIVRRITMKSTSSDLAVRLLRSLELIVRDFLSLIWRNEALNMYLTDWPLNQSSALLAARISLLSTLVDSKDFRMKSSPDVLWERLIALLTTRLESELLCVGLRCLSMLFTMSVKADRESKIARFTELVNRVMDEVPTLEVRMTCAEIVPCSQNKNLSTDGEMVFLDHWMVILKLLRDDSLEVRYKMAGRFPEFGLCERPCLPIRALSLALDAMVHTYNTKGLLVQLIHRVTSSCLEENDQLLNEQTEDNEEVPDGTDSTVFKPVDRHEYQEDLWLMDQMYESILKMGRLSIMEEMGSSQSEVVSEMLEDVRLSAGLLMSTPFLQHSTAHPRAVFRLYCQVSALAMINVVNALPLSMKNIVVELFDQLLIACGPRVNSLVLRARKVFILRSALENEMSSKLSSLSL